MLDEILQNTTLDKIIQTFEKKNWLYFITPLIGTMIHKFWNFKKGDYTIYAIGQSHLDAAWLWRRKDTIRKNFITFSNALRHIADYPIFTFSCSSPQYFKWMETYFPEKFELIKQRVKEGRLELVGGMWIEPDLNIPSGESLARQRLYGQRYYLEKFGKLSVIGWCSDTFGYPWTLPQILAKSGARYFYTNKMSWNDLTKHPFVIFHWQSPDGSQVLTYSFPYTLNLVIQEPNIKHWKQYASFLDTETKVFNYEIDFEHIKKMRSHKYVHDLGFVYGLGDGGGGPLRIEIAILKEFYRHKELKFCTMLDYFRRLERAKEAYPIWNDELYLEFHRGCYTSQVWLKVLNRKSEFLLYNLEFLSNIACLYGYSYPIDTITRLWKILLFNQFHDILPGSSIPQVYEDTRNDFQRLERVSARLLSEALNMLLKQISTPANGLLLFNSHPWHRAEVISAKINTPAIVKDAAGTEIISQASEEALLFHVKDIPSCGYLVLSIAPVETMPVYNSDLQVKETSTTIILENAYLRVQIDKKTGYVSSIFHKHLKKEALSTSGNRIQIYNERKGLEYPAWNISKYYSKNPLLVEEEVTVSIKESGPVRAIVEVQRISSSLSYKILQQVILLTNTDHVDFKLYLKYHLKSTIVKLAFPLNVESNKISCEIPFGVIKRATKPKTKSQAAMWEIPAQKWVDVSENDFGITLINKTRYGFDARYHPKFKNVVRMTILRVPRYPRAGNPIMSLIPTRNYHEQTEFEVEYSLYIHQGNWSDARSHQLACDFNNPPIQIHTTKNDGPLSAQFEFFSITPHNVLLSAFKRSEDDPIHSFVLRLYEIAGRESTCEVKFAPLFSIDSAFETNLLELTPQKIQSKEHSLHFSIKPYEIKTLLVKLRPS
ncbi:MAG: alpha-mannosidase [Candidatus Helarchaeota archaeon]